MTMIKFKPTRELLKDSMVPFSSMFDSFVNEMNGGSAAPANFFKPAVDVKETETNFELCFALPGLEKSDVKIELKDNHLAVSGEKKIEKTEATKYHRVENHYGKFTRTFVLPENVNGDSINAEFKNGILTISIPKAEAPAPKTIEIK